MFLMVGCGGNDIESSRGYGYSECSYGSYKCKGGDSYWCGYTNGSNDLIWQLSERCSYSCDDYTGKCTSGSSGENGGGNSGGGNSGGSNAAYQTCCDLAYCFDACSDQNCYDNCLNNSSSVAINDYNYIFECGDIFGCDPDGDGYYDSSCLSTYCGSYLTSCCYAVDNGGDDDCEKEKIECNQDPFAEMMGYYEEISQHCYRETCDSVWHCDTSETCPNGCNFSTGFCNNSSGGGSTSECSSGQYMCTGSYSYYCSGGYWDSGTYCSNGCNSSTGQCNSNSGGGGGSTSECTSGDYKCSGSYSYYCSYGSWTSDQYCSNGCNSSTGKCKSSSGGGSTSECSSGDYKCSGSYSYYCSYGSWTSDQYCSNGCDSSTGKCKSSSGGGGSTTGNKPCIDDFNGAYTGTDSTYLELHWSLEQTGTCGKAEKVTLQVQVGSSYKTLTEKSAYLYDTYSFDAEPYFSSYPYQVYVSLEAKNSYGSTFWSIGCDYKENHFGDYDICYTILHY